MVLPRPTSSAKSAPRLNGADSKERRVDLMWVQINARASDGSGQPARVIGTPATGEVEGKQL